MAVGGNNGVVGLTGFSNKRCVGFCSGHKTARNKGVVAWRGPNVVVI